MKNTADISETDMLKEYGEKVCMNMLKDHTTKQNIYWATDSYQERGEKYSFFAPITLDLITGENGMVIRPRADKERSEQTQRAKDRAEVFTPAWVCNAQNNLIDEAWFGRKERLFNSPDPNEPHRWINNDSPISFEGTGKTWKDYVSDTRLEITCGEAPYLANRYNAVTGVYNEDVIHRIGMLDRKLRIVSENTKDSKEWILWGKIALSSTYGFEWQGDNLLLAREALFYTFKEHYVEQFGEKKFNQNKLRMMPGVAYIVSWNIWQMDGLTYGLPGHAEDIANRQRREEQYRIALKEYERKVAERELMKKNSLFGDDAFGLPPLEKPLEPEIQPYEQYCVIKDFLSYVNLGKSTLRNDDFGDDKYAIKQTFESIVNRNK